MRTKDTRKSVLRFLLPAMLLFCCAVITFLWLHLTASQRGDFKRIASETYDTVFLSMYPIDTYDEADYLYFRAMTILKAEQILPDFSSLKKYIKRITQSGNQVSTVYLGLRPDKITAEELSSLAAAYPSIAFEVIVSYPSMEYWTGLSEGKYQKTLAAYCDFLTSACAVTGTRIYFYSDAEWLTANPSLYINDWNLTADASKYIMTHSDYLGGYQVTPENAARLSSSFHELVSTWRSAPPIYPDLSDTVVIFFGDSIFGNYSDGMSIPGVVHALTNAVVYNCGYGGNSAAMDEKTLITFPGIASAFAEQDLSVLPQNTQVCAGVTEYMNSLPQSGNLCFVVNYGVNDYLNGHPIFSDDPYDITTFGGAVRTAVTCLKGNYPDAQIILCTPLYSARPSVTDTANLQDYADAVVFLAHELDVDCIDNYRYLGIDSTNHQSYLTDLVHPNEQARFIIAKQIISAIGK